MQGWLWERFGVCKSTCFTPSSLFPRRILLPAGAISARGQALLFQPKLACHVLHGWSSEWETTWCTPRSQVLADVFCNRRVWASYSSKRSSMADTSGGKEQQRFKNSMQEFPKCLQLWWKASLQTQHGIWKQGFYLKVHQVARMQGSFWNLGPYYRMGGPTKQSSMQKGTQPQGCASCAATLFAAKSKLVDGREPADLQNNGNIRAFHGKWQWHQTDNQEDQAQEHNFVFWRFQIVPTMHWFQLWALWAIVLWRAWEAHSTCHCLYPWLDAHSGGKWCVPYHLHCMAGCSSGALGHLQGTFQLHCCVEAP